MHVNRPYVTPISYFPASNANSWTIHLAPAQFFCRYFPKVESHTLLYFDSLHAIGFVDRQRITLNTSGPCRLAKPAEVGSLDGRARRLIANKDHGAFVCVPREMAGRLQGEAALGVAIGDQ
jgi:hypothetical protein